MSYFYKEKTSEYGSGEAKSGKIMVHIIGGTVLVLVLLAFAVPAMARYQKRQNAQNNILVTELEIKNTAQKVEVEKQKAKVRVAEANGISRSQHIINATLTDQYLQHEAINAQREMANSPNHTTIYIPSGQNGVPVVNTIDPEKN